MKQITISQSVLEQIQATLLCPEMGGILGADSEGNIIAYYYDEYGVSDETTYFPDVKSLNQVIRHWFEVGIYFVGFVHSHEIGKEKLSIPDRNYAEKIKEICQMRVVVMLLYIPKTKKFYDFLV